VVTIITDAEMGEVRLNPKKVSMLKATPKNARSNNSGKSLELFFLWHKQKARSQNKSIAPAHQQNKTISIDVLWHYIFCYGEVTVNYGNNGSTKQCNIS
jgi:hypothetical protein